MDEMAKWLRTVKIGSVVSIRGFLMQHFARFLGIVPLTATLSARVIRKSGEVEDLGVVSAHVVTDAFVEYLVDSLQGTEADWVNFKYHDSGTGTDPAATGDTALQTPTGEARDIGSQIEGATADIYKSVATNTYGGTFSITEHGLFNAAAAGTLMDRSVFTAIGIESGDKIEWTYQLTCTAGG